MILLTVGTQLPFDRLVRAVDRIAADLDEPVFGQIGPASFIPQHMEWVETLAPAEFDQRAGRARLLVSHAGTGSILAAQRHELPVIIMPRRASLGEHRNDHQLATANGLTGRAGIYVARDADDIAALIARTDLEPARATAEQESRRTLVSNLQAFLNA